MTLNEILARLRGMEPGLLSKVDDMIRAGYGATGIVNESSATLKQVNAVFEAQKLAPTGTQLLVQVDREVVSRLQEREHTVRELQLRFPLLGIQVGYAGNCNRSWRLFTTLRETATGQYFSLVLEEAYPWNLEEMTLVLQNVVVHEARAQRATLDTCPCTACVVSRIRNLLREKVDILRVKVEA